LKDEEIYNVFDTRKLLGRPVGVSVNDKSGVAGVAFWVGQQLGVRVDKHEAGIEAMYQEIQGLYDRGRVSSLTQDELMALARKHLPSRF
jgi:hypothetical protein